MNRKSTRFIAQNRPHSFRLKPLRTDGGVIYGYGAYRIFTYQEIEKKGKTTNTGFCTAKNTSLLAHRTMMKHRINHSPPNPRNGMGRRCKSVRIFINPDQLTHVYSPFDPVIDMLRAKHKVIERIVQFTQVRKNFALQTNLSGRAYVLLPSTMPSIKGGFGRNLRHKNKSTSSQTQKAMRAMAEAVAEVVADHRHRAIWRDGKAVWFSSTEAGALHEAEIPYRTKFHDKIS